MEKLTDFEKHVIAMALRELLDTMEDKESYNLVRDTFIAVNLKLNLNNPT